VASYRARARPTRGRSTTLVGAQRLGELLDEQGTEVLGEAFDLPVAESEQRVRSAVSALPDWSGTVERRFRVMGVGVDEDLTLRLGVEKRGDTPAVDLSGTSVQVRAPINILPQAVEAAVITALVSFVDPTIPINEGARAAVEIRNPRD
jgi:N-methylhydantoinase B